MLPGSAFLQREQHRPRHAAYIARQGLPVHRASTLQRPRRYPTEPGAVPNRGLTARPGHLGEPLGPCLSQGHVASCSPPETVDPLAQHPPRRPLGHHE
eukprot:604584-Pyramimonas_sp.AAC.1